MFYGVREVGTHRPDPGSGKNKNNKFILMLIDTLYISIIYWNCCPFVLNVVPRGCTGSWSTSLHPEVIIIVDVMIMMMMMKMMMMVVTLTPLSTRLTAARTSAQSFGIVVSAILREYIFQSNQGCNCAIV